MLLLPLLLVAGSLHAQPDEPEKVKVVAFAQDTLGNDWRLAQVRQVKERLSKQSNIRFVFSDATGDTAKQIRDIEDYILSGVDVLITSPRDSMLMTPVIQKVYRDGTPVILLSRTIGTNDYTSFIHPDNRKIGQKAAKFIANRINGQGSVVMLTGVPGATTTLHRTETFRKVIKQYPGITLVSRAANYLRADAIRVMEDLIIQNKKIDAIYAQSDSMAAGAIMALKTHGIDPKKITIVGIDYISEARELIRKGELDATYLYPTAGTEGAQIALDILAGKKVKKEIIIKSVEITVDNVNQIKPIF